MARFSTRCFHYDERGKPLHGGCFKPNCNFVHPTDPEWETASVPKSKRTPISPGKQPSYYHRSARDSSRSRSPRPSNRPRSRSRSRSPTRYRRSSASMSRMESRAGPSDGYNRASRSSVASHSPAPPRQPPAFAPPPPPPPPPLLPVPPSLPAAFAAPNAGAAPKPSTREEMKVMWDTVLPLMADCVEARKVHQDSLRNLHDFEKMLQTPRYTVLTKPEDKARVDRQLAELKAVSEEKARGVTTALNLLKETNWWPVGPNQDEGAAEKYHELIQYAMKLNNTATEMYQAYTTKTLAAPGASGPTTHTADPRDPASSRPLKRRRVSDAAEDAPPALDAADAAELEKLQDKVVALEGRVCDFENDILAVEMQNRDDILTLVEEKFEAFSLQPREGANSSRLESADQSVKKSAQDLDDLGKEVASLMADAEELHRKTEQLSQEKAADLAELEAMRAKLQEYEETSKRERGIMDALGAALDAYRNQPPAPTSIPLDFLISSIDEPIRDAVRAVVRPMVDEMAQDLQQKMVQQDGQLYSELWGKIALTLKVVDAVSKVTPAGRSPALVS